MSIHFFQYFGISLNFLYVKFTLTYAPRIRRFIAHTWHKTHQRRCFVSPWRIVHAGLLRIRGIKRIKSASFKLQFMVSKMLLFINGIF